MSFAEVVSWSGNEEEEKDVEEAYLQCRQKRKEKEQ